jgi:hypothetical protein
MPKFRYFEINFGVAPVGVYVAQITNAKKTMSKSSGNEMIVLTVRTIPDGYSLKYYLVFNGSKPNDGLITQFCKCCEGELLFPEDPNIESSLTAADTMFRIVFVDVIHETAEGDDEPQARIKFGGILSRAKALARAPELANIRLPANMPPPKDLAIMPKEEKHSRPATGNSPLPDDDIRF